MMSDTASLELCKELYALTADIWDDETDFIWKKDEPDTQPVLVSISEYYHGSYWTHWPAYTAGYLLRKLPNGVSVDKASDGYGARRPPMYGSPENPPFKGQIRFPADTPEDALAKLVIELFKEGILPISRRG